VITPSGIHNILLIRPFPSGLTSARIHNPELPLTFARGVCPASVHDLDLAVMFFHLLRMGVAPVLGRRWYNPCATQRQRGNSEYLSAFHRRPP
jgi:hypothetical protein